MVHVVSIGCIQVDIVVDERTWRCVNGDSVMDFRTPYKLLSTSSSATLLQTQFPLPYQVIYGVTNTSPVIFPCSHAMACIILYS